MIARRREKMTLDALEDDNLRKIALWKMEGCTNQEVADRLGYALTTVERRLRLTRKRWEKELHVDEPESNEDHP